MARKQGAPTFPVPFAIDNDGSVWILDAVKHWIAHYSPQGRFAGSLDGGLRLDPYHPHPMDMAIIGRSVYVLLEETFDNGSWSFRAMVWKVGPRSFMTV